MSLAGLAFLVLVGGLIIATTVLLARWSSMATWRTNLVAYQIHPPTNLTSDQIAAWLAGVSAMTHPPRLSVVPLPPLCLEVVSTQQGVTFYVLVVNAAVDRLLAGLRANLPGCRLTEASEYLDCHPRWQVAAELTMTNHDRPLAIERTEQTSTALLAALQPVTGADSEIRLQYIFAGAGTAQPVPTPKTNRHTPPSWIWDNAVPQEAEAVQAARAKRRDALLASTVRVGVAANTKPQAYALLGRVWNNYHTLNNVGVRLRRRYLPSNLIVERFTKRTYPVTRWPLLFGSKEATGVVPFPLAGQLLPGVAVGSSRQLPPSPNMPSRGHIIGMSNYTGLTNRPLALKTEDRLRHQFTLGPTGSGKSWLLANQILQDIEAGHGLIAIDTKGDLAAGVLGRVRDRDRERVIVLDASQRDHPIGLNILGGAHDEASCELTVDNILSIFRSIWSDFWGPRSDSVARAALATLISAHGVDGSALTLCELVPLLTEPAFRRFVTSQPTVPDTTRAFWQRYENMSDGERQQAISPLAYKVEAFTSRTPIRLMLGQSNGLDLRDIFWHRKVVLVNLAKGSIGTETANMLGSLLVSLLWQATLSRVAVPAIQRHACFAYIDEAADLMRLPIPLDDLAAQARGLGLGLILAVQILDQVPDYLRAAFLGTIRTQATFAVEREDAKMLEPRFAPLTADDLQGLARYEVALRPCLDGVTRSPLTLTTLPLAEPIRDADELAADSRQRYGQARADVEAALRARVALTSDSSSIGRRRRGGSA